MRNLHIYIYACTHIHITERIGGYTCIWNIIGTHWAFIELLFLIWMEYEGHTEVITMIGSSIGTRKHTTLTLCLISLRPQPPTNPMPKSQALSSDTCLLINAYGHNSNHWKTVNTLLIRSNLGLLWRSSEKYNPLSVNNEKLIIRFSVKPFRVLFLFGSVSSDVQDVNCSAISSPCVMTTIRASLTTYIVQEAEQETHLYCFYTFEFLELFVIAA